MNTTIKKILNEAQDIEKIKFERALVDLKFIIERYTMNRYGDSEVKDYLKLFYDKSLVYYKLKKEELTSIKYFLFFILFNFPDRAVLTAKCIKVLFDESVREAICTGIEIYMEREDDVACELIFAITNLGDMQNYFNNKRIRDLLIKVSKFGGENSKKATIQQLSLFKKEFDPNFTW